VTDSPPVATRGLVKRYGEIVAVDHVDLTVEPGDVFGYLGPNGAGKTTSLRMMLGLIRPTEGSVHLFGCDPLVNGAKALEGVAGFVEEPRFYPLPLGPPEPSTPRRLRRRRLALAHRGDARSRRAA
jgi:ABC-2 type transport system ATP-binding protein